MFARAFTRSLCTVATQRCTAVAAVRAPLATTAVVAQRWCTAPVDAPAAESTSDRRQVPMRQGDWKCPACGEHNFSRRRSCFSCAKPREDGGAPAFGGKSADWTCPTCGTSNHAQRRDCFMCSAPNPDHSERAPAQRAKKFRTGDWNCPSCNVHNFASRAECFQCGAARPADASGARQRAPKGQLEVRDGDWACPSCASHNFAFRKVCLRCSTPKPPQPEAPKLQAQEEAAPATPAVAETAAAAEKVE